MEDPPHAVPHKLADDAQLLPVGDGLDGVPDGGHGQARADERDGGVQGFLGRRAQAARVGGGRGRAAHEKHAGGVAVVAVQVDGDVDVEDVAGDEGAGVGDAWTRGGEKW